MIRTLIVLLALQTADAEMSRIEEWAKSQPDNGPAKIGIGDEYYKAARKFPKDRVRFMDRASDSWAAGWPDLDEFWKDKTRENLKKIYTSPAGAATRAISKEWTVETVAVSGERVRSGAFSARITMAKDGALHHAMKMSVNVPAATLSAEISAWVLTDGTDSTEDDLKVITNNAEGKLLSAPGVGFSKDLPVWRQSKITVSCEKVSKLMVFFEFQSKKGVAFVDDVSVKLDGKEMVKDGGFEGR